MTSTDDTSLDLLVLVHEIGADEREVERGWLTPAGTILVPELPQRWTADRPLQVLIAPLPISVEESIDRLRIERIKYSGTTDTGKSALLFTGMNSRHTPKAPSNARTITDGELRQSYRSTERDLWKAAVALGVVPERPLAPPTDDMINALWSTLHEQEARPPLRSSLDSELVTDWKWVARLACKYLGWC